MTPHRRGPWSQSEDRCLLQLVQAQGAQCWVRISHLLGTRSPKQCRERYHQNLKPTLNHEPITPEEGVLIERLVGEMGKKWAEIARRLQGRSDNAVKNWWNGGVNRRTRMNNQRGTACHRETASKVPVRQLPLPPPGPITISPAGRNFEAPLPSPSMASEISRADSAEGAPSLVSDSASTFSTSPRLPVSPSVNGENVLPQLSSNRSEGRRPSLPLLHVGTNTFASERDLQTPGFISSFDTDRKIANGHFSSSVFGRNENPFESPQEYHYLRHKIPSPVPAEHRLPPIRLLCAATQQTDGRMNLSNILG
jgi:Myb-like DNA-binding protein FlbD